jgi:myo-inositol-hexaphosphate 3-phosphohydrolase
MLKIYTETQSGFIMIYDLNGKLLQSYKLNSGDNKVEMDLSVYSNGVYMYQIVINGETIEHKELVISK